MNFKSVLAGGVVALCLSAAAQAAVVNFDDLGGQGEVADGYGGVLWDNNWTHYDFPDDPYNAASGNVRVFANYDNHNVGEFEAVGFRFAGPVVFNGASFSGGFFTGVNFELYLGGVLVATSDILDQTNIPTFLASGYGGNVDEVRVYGSVGHYAMDDVSFIAGSVPEPATWALMLTGFGLAGMSLRARRRGFAVA